MNKSNPEYEYKKVNSREIHVDELYQRSLDRRRVAQIVKKFNPFLVNACKVSYRDGKLWVFDGQHTIAALKAKNNGKDVLCDCKVFYGMTRIDEAELFVQQNGIARNVQTNAKFRALFNAGDKDVVGMSNAVESIGLKLGFKNCGGRNTIRALSTLFKLYMTMDAKIFKDFLSIIKEAWGGAEESFCAEILNGVSIFCATYHGQFKRRDLVNRLKRRIPVEIVREGKISSASGSLKYARVILGIYNSGTSTGRLPDIL